MAAACDGREGVTRANLSIRHLAIFLTAVAALMYVTPAAAEEGSRTPAIEGTYRLVLRELPDGSKQQPPDVIGLMTYTEGYRNFNVYWKDATGKADSISYIAKYKLTDKEYSETNVYWMANDEIGGKPLTYDLSPASGSSPVSRKNGTIEFRLPLHDEPSAVFKGNTFVASRPGAFVDHWEKVK